MNWGYRIFFSFVVFMGLIITLVVISMRQDINLVAEDYYKQEIEYQAQIDRLKRTQDLPVQPEIHLVREENKVFISLNQENVEQGAVVFYRPSDANRDKLIDLGTTGEQVVSTAGWERGLWTVKLRWKSDGEEYYTEQNISL